MTESNKWLLSLSSVDRDVPNILITPVRFFLLLDKKKGWKEGKLLVAARWRWRGKTYFRLCLVLLFPSSRYSIYLILSYPARSLVFSLLSLSPFFQDLMARVSLCKHCDLGIWSPFPNVPRLLMVKQIIIIIINRSMNKRIKGRRDEKWAEL